MRLLVPFIAGSVLNHLNNKTKANAKTRALNKFVMKLPVDMAYLGMIGVGLPIALKIYGIVRQDEMGLALLDWQCWRFRDFCFCLIL